MLLGLVCPPLFHALCGLPDHKSRGAVGQETGPAERPVIRLPEPRLTMSCRRGRSRVGRAPDTTSLFMKEEYHQSVLIVEIVREIAIITVER